MQEFQTVSAALRSSPLFKSAQDQILNVLKEKGGQLTGVQPSHPSPQAKEILEKSVGRFASTRGRGPYYPIVVTGFGSGPFIELMDGSIKYDMISGIGVNLLGHGHPELTRAVLEGAVLDVMQGNLEPALESIELVETLIPLLGPKCRLKFAWPVCSGTMANEMALKIIRQKKSPATRIFAFKDCFCGRSTAMQELTDNPGFREGQPLYGEVTHVPFYDETLGLQKSIQNTLEPMRKALQQAPGKYAAIMMELVQGEGGIRSAPREFYVALMEEARKNNLAIWIDEIQTFGRTGELFAFQTFQLHEYVDVVTVAKALQASMMIYTEEFNPKPGLVSATFSGSTAALKAGKRVLEILSKGDLLGPNGKIMKLSKRFETQLTKLAEGSCKGKLGTRRIFGGMIAFQPFDGTLDKTKATLRKLLDLGVVAFYCGHDPYLVRMLPPLPVMTEQQVDEVCQIIEKALLSG